MLPLIDDFRQNRLTLAGQIKINEAFGDEAAPGGQGVFLDTLFSRIKREELEAGGAGQVRYPQKTLQLPGGENYRELLLKLPGERGAEGGADGRVIFRSESAADDFLTHISAEGLEDLDYGRVSNEADIYNLLPPESVVVEFNNIPANDLTRFREVAETNRGNLTVSKTQQEPTSMFTGGHWDEPNVIAHIRFNERVDPDGNKVLFIEEIQSDWAHKGHEEGFKEPLTKLPEGVEIVKKEDNFGGIQYSIVGPDKPVITFTPETENINAEALSVYNEMKNRKQVQPGPFVTDAHQWTNLALKRMIRWGSDEGFDSIAWVTGKQSADRYNASKYVDSIYWNPETTRLTAIEKGSNRKVIDAEKVPENKLVDYIGKEPAKRLLESPRDTEERLRKQYRSGLITWDELEFMANSHSLEGADMNIGGEYHKFIYDKVLTEQAKKIGKKHGAKVEEGGVMASNPEKYRDDLRNAYVINRMEQFEPRRIGDDPVTFRDELADIYHTPDDVVYVDSNGEYVMGGDGHIRTFGRGYEDAEEQLQDMVVEQVSTMTDKELMEMFPDLEEAAEKVWTMRLTDKLKEASREGLPYYMVLPPLVIGGAAAQRTDAQRQQAKTDAQAILNQ